MRALALALALSCLFAAGCTVESSRPRRDAGPFSDDAPIPPGVDAPHLIPDTPRPDVIFAGADSDADGLSDEDEAARGTNPHSADTDGDGQSDGVEAVAGTDPTSASSFIPGTDFYVVLPYGDPAIHRDLSFRARLGRGDVFFLVDTTGSMTGPINNVRTSLATVIVPALRDSIADLVMGVGDFRDFPISPYGGLADWAMQVRQTMTGDVAAVQTALNALRAAGGGDGPESSTEGLYVSVADPCGVPPGPDDPGPGFGAACFRTMSHPIIVHVTDVPFHNGPTPMYDYGVGDADGDGLPDPPVPAAHTWAETVAALTANDVHVIGAGVGATRIFGITMDSPATPDLNALADATGSRDSMGTRTVYQVFMGNVTTAVVDGIIDLVGAVTQDVTSQKRDDASDAVDATLFIRAITPVSSSRPTTFDATTFYDVPGGTTVTFDVAFINDFQPPMERVQIFQAYIDVYDLESMTVLDTRNVYIVVPPEDGILF